jgi:UDP-N-acetylmuramate--alanine ligase
MGIGGQGISAVAQMAQMAGDVVTGCDQRESATVKALQQAGIAVQIGHDAHHLADVDALVISPAVPALDPQNPELLAAQQRGLRVITWQELLGELMLSKCVLSVSGVHGKGTTTAMLSLMLVDANLDPTCEIGAVVPRFGANYRLGNSDYFVNEADEYNHNFWHYHPRLVIVTSIEYEHPEFFPDYDAYLSAFEHFVRGMDLQREWPLPPTLILNADSAGCHDLHARLHNWPGRILTYSVKGGGIGTERATVEAYDVRLEGETSFRVKTNTGQAFPQEQEFHLLLPGVHNIENALAALTAAHVLGVEATSIAQTLATFSGTRRRFEIRHQGPLALGQRMLDVMLIDDYAHHPTAIELTLTATHQRYPDRRIIAVYQPHMYSRTKTFFNQFLHSFDAVDVAIIADIFPARERDTGLVHARQLAAAIQQEPHFAQAQAQGQVFHGGSIEETTRLLVSILRAGDVVVVMGAGDIYMVTEALLNGAYQA